MRLCPGTGEKYASFAPGPGPDSGPWDTVRWNLPQPPPSAGTSGERSCAGAGNTALWGPLLVLLGEETESLPVCWGRVCRGLPAPLDAMLAPLGPLLPGGGKTLERAIEETREELTGFAGEERLRQAAAGRLTAAVCLSGACLGILVLM